MGKRSMNQEEAKDLVIHWRETNEGILRTNFSSKIDCWGKA